MLAFISLLIIILQCLTLSLEVKMRSKLQLDDEGDWDYSSLKGPATWATKYRKCAGKSQSPINLNLLSVSNPELGLIFEGFETPIGNVVFENELNVKIYNPGLVEKQTVTGLAVNGNRYRLYQFHFHWGPSNFFGTEHALFGRRYALEMHTVLLNVKYEGIANDEERERAYLSDPDGVLVLTVLHKATHHDNPLFVPIASCLKNVLCKDDRFTTTLDASLLSFYPKTLGNFFKYQGSFTTPPCSEVVTWVVFKQTMSVGIRQLVEFRKLRGKGCRDEIGYNLRNLQPLNGRIVETSF